MYETQESPRRCLVLHLYAPWEITINEKLLNK